MNYDTIGYLRVLEFGFFCLMSRVSYLGIKSALGLGVGYEYYLDLYCINLAVQGLCVISSYFWAIYGLIPAYLLYYAFKFLLAWASSTGKAEEPEIQDPKSKKKEKKEKIKYIKSR